MADNEDILQKADTLMRRHRVFVAGGEPLPPAEGSGPIEDIPVLTEVVEAPATSLAIPVGLDPEAVEDFVNERLAALLPARREMLTRELEGWLDEQLPQIVMRLFDGITDQLVAQVSRQARSALLPRLQAALEAKLEAEEGPSQEG